MTKRINKQLQEFSGKDKRIKFSLGTLVVVGLSIIAMMISTFTVLDLPNFQGLNIFLQNPSNFIQSGEYQKYSINYFPQIPILLFICTILERKFSMLVIISYLILGLFFPIFAMGGGIKYFLQYNFGYLLACVPATFIATAFLKQNRKILNILKTVIATIFIIQTVGMIYLMLLGVAKHDTFLYVWSMISSNQNLLTLFYDFILGFLAIMIARPAKQILWLAMG